MLIFGGGGSSNTLQLEKGGSWLVNTSGLLIRKTYLTGASSCSGFVNAAGSFYQVPVGKTLNLRGVFGFDNAGVSGAFTVAYGTTSAGGFNVGTPAGVTYLGGVDQITTIPTIGSKVMCYADLTGLTIAAGNYVYLVRISGAGHSFVNVTLVGEEV